MDYLAVDIGASSGRHVLGSITNGRLKLTEIYRFENRQIERNGHVCWDIDRLFNEIKNGLKECTRLGKKPVSMGIDCFGVDFVLLDKQGNILGDTVAYRDSRTAGADKKVYSIIDEEELYKKTGIANQIFNTIYQLYAALEETPEHLEQAERFLLLPEYFSYLLTGNMKNEYTNGTTTQLVNIKTPAYDKEIIEKLGLPAKIFGRLYMPGESVGMLKPEIAHETGQNLEVLFPPSHDTASAVMAVPTGDDCLYISSGTWSLMGTLLCEADCSKASFEKGFTNEGGYNGSKRYLKNIMGLWIVQNIRKELDNQYSFSEMADMAMHSSYEYKIDVTDDIFFAPESMIQAVYDNLNRQSAPKPETIGDMLNAVYNGLAQCYADTAKEIETILDRKFDSIYIVGGGSQNKYLNELTAKYTGKNVFAGPAEATAIGNIVSQAIAKDDYENVSQAKKAIRALIETESK